MTGEGPPAPIDGVRGQVVYALLLASCVRDIEVLDGGDLPPRRDDRGVRLDAGSDAGLGGDGGFEQDGGFGEDASVRDSGPGNQTGCMRRIEDAVRIDAPNAGVPFREIRGLSFDPGGRLYVAGNRGMPARGFVTILSPAPARSLVRVLENDLGFVRDVVVDPGGNVLVLEYQRPGGPVAVTTFDPGGTHIGRWTYDDEAYGFDLGGDGLLYIGGYVISRYRTNGTFVDTLGLTGAVPGRIGLAQDVAYDHRGYAWVADFIRNIIHQYDISARDQVRELGGRGSGPGRFDGNEEPMVVWGPTRIALDRDGNLYANDPFVSRIQKLDREGNFLGEFGFGGSRDIGPIAIDPTSGWVYVGRNDYIAVVCPL